MDTGHRCVNALVDRTVTDDEEPRKRLALFALQWRVTIEQVVDTPGSLIANGRRGGDEVVVKIIKLRSDERRSGYVLRALGGNTVRVHDVADGALLMERLSPGTSLVELVVRGEDERATAILAEVLGAMSVVPPDPTLPAVEAWGEAFAWYQTTGDRRIPRSLVRDARDVFSELCRSQRHPRLLHGDLQHSNVLYDHARGWTVIDPKGVVGEMEYELGALFRNPRETPVIFTNVRTFEYRLSVWCSRLALDERRAAGWAFAQAVLSAIWGVQDGDTVREDDPSLLLARTIRPLMLGSRKGG